MITPTRQQRLAALHGQAYAAAGAVLLDRMGQREAAVVVGLIAIAAGMLTTTILLHEDQELPADMMRGVLMAISAKAVLILYAVLELTFGAME